MKTQADILKEIAALSKELALHMKTIGLRGVERLPGSLPAEAPRQPEAPKVEAEPAVVAPPTDLGKEARLDFLRRQALECKRCRLASTRSKVVFGEGSSNARVILVGEGPGAQEDKTGLPFVGRAGKLLTKMLASIGLDRKDVFITNIVKCRPPGNRDPQPDEVAACRPFLNAQLEIIAPPIVVTLGRPSAQTLLSDRRPLSRLRSTIHKFGESDLIVTYHPAFLLRSPARKKAAWADLLLLVDLMVKKGIREELTDLWWTK